MEEDYHIEVIIDMSYSYEISKKKHENYQYSGYLGYPIIYSINYDSI